MKSEGSVDNDSCRIGYVVPVRTLLGAGELGSFLV